MLLVLPLLTAGAGANVGLAVTTTAAAKPTFVVDVRVAEPLTLTVDDLRTFTVQRQKVHFSSGSGKESYRYQGALLIDVLTSAKPHFDPDVKNDKLRHAVLVGATDGYQAALAWGEIDPGFANTRVLRCGLRSPLSWPDVGARPSTPRTWWWSAESPAPSTSISSGGPKRG